MKIQSKLLRTKAVGCMKLYVGLLKVKADLSGVELIMESIECSLLEYVLIV